MKKQKCTKTIKSIICFLILFALCTEIFIPIQTKAAELPALSDYQFKLIQKKQLSDGNVFYYMEHNSGAKVIYTDDKSDDKTFGIGFRTPATDNKGAAHVLEHAVLSGSELYPSKNLFNYMTTISVATEMNGYTLKDYTLYPFITRNKKDYENLLSVYLSCVFRPMFLKEENIFRREGIRKEYKDGKAYYNGVVYNEKRGKSNDTNAAVSNAAAQVMEQLMAQLYKGTNLDYSGGGTIEGLKTLTYEDILKTYQKYYTTSNCLVYLSGNVDLKYTLKQLDDYFTKYGKKGEKASIHSTLFPIDKFLETEYAIEKTDDNYSAGIITSGAKSIDPKERKTFELIWNYIAAKKLAPLYEDLGIIGDESYYSTMGVVLPRGSKSEAEKFLDDYQTIIDEIEKNGLSTETVKDQLEKINANAYSNSLYKVYSAMEGFTYGDNPLLLLDYSLAEEEIKKESSSYFSDFVKKTIKKYQVTILSHGKTEAIPESTDQVTEDINLEQIKKETEEYNEWAETEETKAVLSKNPTLERKDFETVDHDFSTMKQIEDGIIYTYSNIDNPNKYSFTLSFDLFALGTEKEIREAQLLCQLFNIYLREQGIYNISCITQTYEKKVNTDSYIPVFQIWGNGAKEQLTKSIQLVQKQLINNKTIFDGDNFSKMVETIKKTVNTQLKDRSLLRTSEIAAMLSNAGKYSNIASGLAGEGSSSYGAWLNTLKKTEYNTLIKELKQIKKKVMNKNSLTASFNGTSDLFSAFKKQTKSLSSVLEQKKYKKSSMPLPKKTLQSVAYITDGKENTGSYAQMGSVVTKKTPVHGSIQVLANYLTSAYISPKMRSIGAYGGHFEVTANGSFKINVSKVSDVKAAQKQLKNIGSFLKNAKLTQKELDANIIAVVNTLDKTYLYSQTSSIDYYFHGFTKATYLKLRKEILSTTVKDIKAYADVLEKEIAKNYISAMGNKTFISSFNLNFKKVYK